jgi:hypothetical protein
MKLHEEGGHASTYCKNAVFDPAKPMRVDAMCALHSSLLRKSTGSTTFRRRVLDDTQSSKSYDCETHPESTDVNHETHTKQHDYLLHDI